MARYEAKYDFGTVTSVRPEALGQPGKRTFRLLLVSGAASARIWLEKEQLQQLAVYIQEVSGALSQKASQAARGTPQEAWSGSVTEVEFKVSKLAIGHDATVNAFTVLAHDAEAPEDAPAELKFWVTLDMAKELAKEALEVCAAGRPSCFLCGQPINPEGHMCIRSNGHQPLQP